MSLAATYEPVSTSGMDEFELNDVTDEVSHSEDGRRDRQELLIKRAYGSLGCGHAHPKAGPLQEKSKNLAWQGGLRQVTIGASVILVLNIVFIIFVPTRYGITEGISTFYRGNCNKASWIDSGLHVAINILSTLFMSASNYVMQILNSPTRERVTYWHRRGHSLHIGIPSLANARRVPGRQSILWFLLGISAIPLHLFWNSAVFGTVQTNEYNIFLVSNNFNETDFLCNNNLRCDQAEDLHTLSRTPNGLEYLDTATCIQKYSVDFLQGRSNLLLVGNTTQIIYPGGAIAINGSLFQVSESINWLVHLQGEQTPVWLPTSWWCGGIISKTEGVSAQVTSAWSKIVNLNEIYSMGIDIPQCSMAEAVSYAADLGYLIRINESDSNPLGIDYCLSQVVPEICSLGFSVYIMAIVIACNIIKVVCMIASFWVLDDEPLVTIGDALSSFLKEPDEITKGQCLTEARGGRISCPTIWHPKNNSWMHAPTVPSIIRYIICCIISLIAAASLLTMGLNTLSSEYEISFSSLAFSAVNPSAMIQNVNFTSTFTSAVLLANAPQLLFSTLYFMYNRLLSAMVSMDEWSRFLLRRATLRVSYPTLGQRSSYWLSLPYKYSIPLLIVTSIMHWLVSQSLYLASIEIYNSDGKPFDIEGATDADGNPLGNPLLYYNGPINTSVGYSPKAITVTIAVGCAMLLFLIAFGFRRYKLGMVLIGNNSLAISAACHPPKEDSDPAHSKLMWGAVYHEDGMKPGHCCLTSMPVTRPVDGQRYA